METSNAVVMDRVLNTLEFQAPLSPKTVDLYLPNGITSALPVTSRGGITPNPGTPIRAVVNMPEGGDILKLLSLEKVKMPVVSFRGLTPKGITQLFAYVDPAIFFSQSIAPASEFFLTSLLSQEVTFDSGGVAAAPLAPSTSLNYGDIPCFGYLVVSRGVNTMSGIGELNLNLTTTVGVNKSPFAFQMQDIEGTGYAFISRVGEANSANFTQAAGADAVFGAYPNSRTITLAQANGPQSAVLKAIFQNSDVNGGVAYSTVITGKNTFLTVYPVLQTPETRLAFYAHMLAGKMDSFGTWIINNYLNMASARLV